MIDKLTEEPPEPEKLTGDGLVNIFDLVIVAGNFGKSLLVAAPSMISKIELITD